MNSDEKRLIVVLGMHRSGTSAVTRGLTALGVELGNNFLPAQADNVRGFWEDADLNALNMEMLNLLNRDWHFLAPIEQTDVDVLCQKGYRQRAIELLQAKTSTTEVFGFKDPRLAKLLPFWKEVFSHGQFIVSYIITIRHPLSVRDSLAVRNHFDPEKSYLLWLDHILSSLVGTLGENSILIDYDRLMLSPEKELGRIAKKFGLQINLPELEKFKTEFLDETLRHTVYQLDDMIVDPAIPPLTREVYEETLNIAMNGIQLNDEIFSNKVMLWNNEFSRQRSALVLADKLTRKIDSMHQAIAEKELFAREITRQMAEKEQVVQNLTRHMTEKEQFAQELARQTAEKEQVVQELSRQMTEEETFAKALSNQLRKIYRSRSWRWTEPLRRLFDFFSHSK